MFRKSGSILSRNSQKLNLKPNIFERYVLYPD